ncbi:carbamoyl-phosphate synthase large subunit, partial [Pseudomonas aeruginosa]
ALGTGDGLYAKALSAPIFYSLLCTCAGPSGEIGAMVLEVAWRLCFAKQLAAQEDPHRREARFRGMVDKGYRQCKALIMASYRENDAVIDAAETRGRLMRGLAVARGPAPRAGRKRPCVDTG